MRTSQIRIRHTIARSSISSNHSRIFKLNNQQIFENKRPSWQTQLESEVFGCRHSEIANSCDKVLVDISIFALNVRSRLKTTNVFGFCVIHSQLHSTDYDVIPAMLIGEFIVTSRHQVEVVLAIS